MPNPVSVMTTNSSNASNITNVTPSRPAAVSLDTHLLSAVQEASYWLNCRVETRGRLPSLAEVTTLNLSSAVNVEQVAAVVVAAVILAGCRMHRLVSFARQL